MHVRTESLPGAWNDLPPEDAGWGLSSKTGVISGAAWRQCSGLVPPGGRVTVRFADGTEAPVVAVGRLWWAEWVDDRGPAVVEVGDETFPVDDGLMATLERLVSDSSGDSPVPTPSPAVEEIRHPGVAYLIWEDHSHWSADWPEPRPADAYACSLLPNAGDTLPVEHGPSHPELDDALQWARARTPYIVIAPHWDHRHRYSVTDGPPEEWRRID